MAEKKTDARMPNREYSQGRSQSEPNVSNPIAHSRYRSPTTDSRVDKLPTELKKIVQADHSQQDERIATRNFPVEFFLEQNQSSSGSGQPGPSQDSTVPTKRLSAPEPKARLSKFGLSGERTNAISILKKMKNMTKKFMKGDEVAMVPPEDVDRLKKGQRDICNCNIQEASTYKDIPRLIHRVVVVGHDQEIVMDAMEYTSSRALPRIATLAKLLAEMLEDRPDNDIKHMYQKLQDIADTAGKADMQLTVAAMFDVIGVDSKVAKLMKMINQSVVLCSVAFLKATLTQAYMTKDVRDNDGWRIKISFENSSKNDELRKLDDLDGNNDEAYKEDCRTEPSVFVSHIRKEQSLDEFGDKTDHFEFTWNVLLRFEMAMLDLVDVEFHILRLEMADTISKNKRKSLQKDLRVRQVV